MKSIVKGQNTRLSDMLMFSLKYGSKPKYTESYISNNATQ